MNGLAPILKNICSLFFSWVWMFCRGHCFCAIFQFMECAVFRLTMWCRVWRFCRRERVMVPYSVQDKGTRLIIELYIAFLSPLSILNDTMWGVNGKNMAAGWENHQPPNPVPKRTNNLPSQEKEVKNRDWHKTWSLQQDPKHNLMSSFWACLSCLCGSAWVCLSMPWQSHTVVWAEQKNSIFFLQVLQCVSRTKNLIFFLNVLQWVGKNKSFFPACSAIPQQIQAHGIPGEKQEFYQCS